MGEKKTDENFGEIEMHILIRILPFVIFIWVIGSFFYSLGRKREIDEQKRKSESPPTKRKRVDCSIIENDNNGKEI